MPGAQRLPDTTTLVPVIVSETAPAVSPVQPEPPTTSHPRRKIWTEFLRKLTRRGLRGVKFAVSDAHEGIKAAVSKVLCATWQRCRVQFMRNALAHAGREDVSI